MSLKSGGIYIYIYISPFPNTEDNILVRKICISHMLSDKLTFKKSCTNLVGVTAEWTENVGLKMSKTGDPILQYSDPKNFLKPQ